MQPITNTPKLLGHKIPGILFILVVLGALVLFNLYPLLKLVQISLLAENVFSFDTYRSIFSNSRFRGAIVNSALLASTVATLSTSIAFVFAFSMVKSRMRGKALFSKLVYLPIVAPPFMFGISIILLFGRNGLITSGLFDFSDYDIYGFDGLVVTQTISMFPIAYLVLTGILQGINPNLENGAMNMGASRMKTFKTVTLPLCIPGLLAAWLLMFVSSITDFGTPILLGGNFDVISVQAYLEFTGMGNLPRGAALAVILIIPTVLVFSLQRRLMRGKNHATITGKSAQGHSILTSRTADRLFFSINCFIGFFMSMMYLTIISCMFIKIWGINWSFTLDHFEYAWDISLGALLNTLILAGIATPIAALIGTAIAYVSSKKKNIVGAKSMSVFALLTYAIPGTATGIGYILAFNDKPFLFTGTAFIIVVCFVSRTLPVGVESGTAALKQISGEIEEAAINMGSSKLTSFRRIVLPLIIPAFFASSSYTFLRSMTSLSAVIFLVSGRWNLLTPLLLSQTEQLRLSTASITSVMLIITLVIGIFILKKISEAFSGKKIV